MVYLDQVKRARLIARLERGTAPAIDPRADLSGCAKAVDLVG